MSLIALAVITVMSTPAPQDRVVYEGTQGPGVGKHIVFLAGDEEYRSEEGLPQLAKILSTRHGFKCTVLFSIGRDGTINPDVQDNQPGLEALKAADLCIMLLRFRQWPDHQMKHFDEYYLTGKPFIALRTSTHAFDFKAGTYERYGQRSKTWPGGFGRHVLGEKWLTHWGNHGSQATRGVIEAGADQNPLLNGVKDVFGTTDVYESHPPADATILMRGSVLASMDATAKPADDVKKTVRGTEQPVNDPMMPIVWTREHTNEAGKTNRVLNTTMGAATDLLSQDLRRLIVNGAYQFTGLNVPAKANVDLVGEYRPSNFGFGGFKKGVKPSDH